MQSRVCFILLLSCLFGLSGSAQEAELRDALQLYDYGRVSQLLATSSDSLSDALRLDAYIVLNRYKEGIQFLQDRLLQDSTNRKYRIKLAELCQLTGNYSQAIDNYNQAIDPKSPNVFLLSKIASLQFQAGQIVPAIRNLRFAMSVDTIQPNLRLLARCYENCDSLDLAVGLYRAAIDRDSTDYIAVSNLATLYLGMDAFDDALLCTERYMRSDSTNQMVNRVNALGYFKTSQYPLALDRYQKLVQSGDSTTNTLYYLGLTYMNCDKLPQSFENLSYVNDKEKGKTPNILGYLGIVSIDLLSLDEGIGMIQESIQLSQPDSIQMDLLYTHLAKGFAWKRNNLKKIELLKKAYEYVHRPLTLYNIGYTYDTMKDDKNAEKYYTQFLKQVEGKAKLNVFDEKMKANASERLTHYRQENFFKQSEK